MASNVKKTLNSRGKSYGNFVEQFRVAQNIKDSMRDSVNWDSLPPEMKESLEMCATKISRILTGDVNHKDSWHDVSGYAKLIDDSLEEVK